MIAFIFSIDATEEPTCGAHLGRLVNHGTRKEKNSMMKVVECDGCLTLCLFATKFIHAGSENFI